jgi:hypothetical protein
MCIGRGFEVTDVLNFASDESSCVISKTFPPYRFTTKVLSSLKFSVKEAGSPAI